MAKRTSSRAERSPSNLSYTELQAALRSHEKRLNKLIRKRDRLLDSAAQIDAQIRELGGPMRGGRGGAGRVRPQNEQALIPSLQAVLKGKTMSVSEAADAVRRAGYQSNAANFRTMVNIALTKKQFFKRVERGRYTAA